MQIKVSNLAAVNVIKWYKEEHTTQCFNFMSLKTQWAMRKNMHALENAVQSFAEFNNDLIQKRNEKWFVEGNGKCEKATITQNGEEIETLKVKEEYIDDFKAYEDDLNNQLGEIATEENEVEITPIDIDKFIDEADKSGASFTADDIEMLMLFTETN